MKVRNSIVFRVGILLTAMTAMAIISMFSSFVISEMADSDAAAINISGSLRKQSYLILSTALAEKTEQTEEKIQHSVSTFDKLVNSQLLEHSFHSEDQLGQQYLDVKNFWFETVRPLFAQGNIKTSEQTVLINTIHEFVDEIDELVLAYQLQAESKIQWLRIIQIIALFGTLLLVYVAMSNIHTHIEQPLKQLTDGANKIKNGDLSAKIDIDSRDELGVLASTFNSMGASLKQLYDSLESKVQEKTKALQTSTDSMTFLYDIARRINEDHEAVDFQSILNEASQLTGLGDMDLCLSTPKSQEPYIHMLTIDDASRPNCDGSHCEFCVGDSNFSSTSQVDYQVKFPLIKDDQNYGVINVRIPYGKGMDSWQHQLVQSVSDQIAVALSLRNQSNQERRVALLNERTIIARELHDSLAQSLSYLKIQVTRLQKAHDKGAQSEVYQNLINEIREGLGSAYRQLRELLATFRLKIHGDGVNGALRDVIQILKERSDMDIRYRYELDKIPLSPNEEIHLVQVAKEALQNAVHHSKGSQVDLSLESVDHQVVLTICDNGIGIPDDPEKLNHYGLAIMKERAKHIQGTLDLYRRESGGTCVELRFHPIEVEA